MRVLGFLFLISALPASAETLVLEEFDQIKLGELLGRLPDSVAPKTVVKVPGAPPGTETQIHFPAQPQGFQIFCRRTFYNGSPYPSFTACTVTMDPAHLSYDRKYDEVRFRLTDPLQVQSLFSAIPYGVPLKEYYSWERNAGTNYEGRSIDVFHYRFECAPESCLLRFSGISVVP